MSLESSSRTTSKNNDNATKKINESINKIVDKNKSHKISIFTKGEEIKSRKNKDKQKSDKANKKRNVDSLSDSDDCDDINDYDSVQMILSFQDIIRNIPNTAVKTPDSNLKKTHTEWRWRFFDLKGRKLVEISKLQPNEERTYMDNTGKWIKYNLKGNWDQFLVDTRYCYIKN